MTLPAIPSRPMTADEAGAAFHACAAVALSRVLPRDIRDSDAERLAGELEPCPRCGQLAPVRWEHWPPQPGVSIMWDVSIDGRGYFRLPATPCGPCRARAREVQGTQERLFAPAPAVMPGQLQL